MKLFILTFTMLALTFSSAAMQTVSFDALDWDVSNVVYWRWIGNSLHNLSGGGYVSSHTIETPQPFSARIVLTPEQKLNNGSAEASLVLRSKDNKQNWHLTFVDTGKQRTVQLFFRNNRKSEKLSSNFESGKNFQWE